MVKKSSYILIAFFIAIALIGCASLDHVMYFEPSAEKGDISESKFIHIGWYPSLTNLITFPDSGIDVYCPNESYNVIYTGPILSTEPMIVLPLFPGLIGFIISPMDFNPDDVIVELHFDRSIKRIQIDPQRVKLLTSDGLEHSPIRVTYGLGYRFYMNEDFVSDNVALAVNEPIAIEDDSGVRNVAFFYNLRAWKTGAFILSTNNLIANNNAVELPQIKFKKKHDSRYFINVD